jgi:hypothetical protein
VQAAAQRTVARSTSEVWAKAWAMAQHMVVQKKMEQASPSGRQTQSSFQTPK